MHREFARGKMEMVFLSGSANSKSLVNEKSI